MIPWINIGEIRLSGLRWDGSGEAESTSIEGCRCEAFLQGGYTCSCSVSSLEQRNLKELRKGREGGGKQKARVKAIGRRESGGEERRGTFEVSRDKIA